MQKVCKKYELNMQKVCKKYPKSIENVSEKYPKSIQKFLDTSTREPTTADRLPPAGPHRPPPPPFLQESLRRPAESEAGARGPRGGIGDLLRYHAGVPRPSALGGSGRLVDLTGDGRADLVGCWNYYHRPGTPISGVVCFPRRDGRMEFGDMARLRYV